METSFSTLGGQREAIVTAASAQRTMSGFGSNGSTLAAPSIDLRFTTPRHFAALLPTQISWFGRTLEVSDRDPSLERGLLGGGLGHRKRVAPLVANERPTQELGAEPTVGGNAAALADSNARVEASAEAKDRLPYVSLIRVMLDRDQVASARTLLSVAIAEQSGDKELRRVAGVLAFPTSAKKALRDRDRTGEYGWLTLHGAEHRGQWVALVGDELVATANSLKQLLLSLETAGRKDDALIHRVV